MPAPRPTPIREEDGQINNELDPAMNALDQDQGDTVTPDTDPNRPLA